LNINIKLVLNNKNRWLQPYIPTGLTSVNDSDDYVDHDDDDDDDDDGDNDVNDDDDDDNLLW